MREQCVGEFDLNRILLNLNLLLLHKNRSIDTDDFKGVCPEEEDTYVDFGHYPGVKLHFRTEPKGRFKLLKTINEAIQVAHNEWQQEKDIELAKKQAEIDRENEIPHGLDGNSASSIYKKIAFNLLLPLILLQVIFAL